MRVSASIRQNAPHAPHSSPGRVRALPKGGSSPCFDLRVPASAEGEVSDGPLSGPSEQPWPCGEIGPLTALRGIAAMMVVMTHFSATVQQHSAGVIPSLVPHGYMAVDLFFVLSGFILAYTHLGEFRRFGLRAFPGFLLRRAARIVPLNTVAVTAILLAGGISQALLSRNILYHSTAPVTDAVCNLLMLQGLGIGENLNAPSWSISAECAAYLLFPALLAATDPRRRFATAALVAVCLAGIVAVSLAQSHGRTVLDPRLNGLLLCVFEFPLGLAMFRATGDRRVRALLARNGVAVVAIGWSCCALALRCDLAFRFSLPLLIASLACCRGQMASLLANRACRFLGTVSFSVYLLHNPLRPVLLEALRVLHPAMLPTVSALAAAAAGSVLVLPLAWASFVWIERPGRQAVRDAAKRLAARRRAG